MSQVNPTADPQCHLCSSQKLSVNYSAAGLSKRAPMFSTPRLRVAWVCPRCDTVNGRLPRGRP